MFENFNADRNWRREWTGRKRGFPKNNKRTNPSTMTTNLPWKASLPFAVFFFFTRTNGRKMETTSRQTQCPVSKILQRYIKEIKLTVLLWPNKLFQHGEIVFPFSESLCYVLLFSCANKNFLFWRLSNDCQIVRPVLVSGRPNRKKPYNKHLISLVFSVRTINYGSSFFFHRFMAQARKKHGP